MLLEIYDGLFRGIKAHHLLSAPAQLAAHDSSHASFGSQLLFKHVKSHRQ